MSNIEEKEREFSELSRPLMRVQRFRLSGWLLGLRPAPRYIVGSRRWKRRYPEAARRRKGG